MRAFGKASGKLRLEKETVGSKKTNRGSKESKKGQVALTITWIMAFLILFFACILFLSTSLFLAASKQIVAGGDKIGFEEYKDEKLDINSQLNAFLNSYMKYNGKKISVGEFLRLEGSENMQDVFDVKAKDFFDNLYPKFEEGTQGGALGVYGILVYDGNKEYQQYGRFICAENDVKAELNLDKGRIRLCLLRRYYETFAK